MELYVFFARLQRSIYCNSHLQTELASLQDSMMANGAFMKVYMCLSSRECAHMLDRENIGITAFWRKALIWMEHQFDAYSIAST